MTAPLTICTGPTGWKCEPVEKKAGNTTITLKHGDLTDEPVDAFVFYAEENLRITSGYGTAIQMRGGVAVKKECEALGGCKMGEAVITGAGEMKVKNIIHAVGPKFQEPDLEQKLRNCMKSSLEVASAKGLKHIAYPPMGTGFYGVPLALSAKVMMEAFKEGCSNGTSLQNIDIVVVDHRDYAPFAEAMEKLL